MKVPLLITDVIVHARIEAEDEATSTQVYVGYGLTYDDALNN